MPNTIRRLAAIDLGTNSFHLVIADVKPNGKFTVVSKDKEMVRLGEGFNEMKHLSEEAMTRAMETLRRFTLIAQSQAAPVRAVATSAVREALNQDEFLQRARDTVGLDIEVVSGYEEARLIYLGVLQALPVYHKNILLVDIGGGSTEFLSGTRGVVEYANSLKLGAVRLTQKFFREDSIRPKNIAACREHLAGAINPIARVMQGKQIDVAIGSSGTIISTAVMVQAMNGTPLLTEETNNLTITRADLARVVDAILGARTVGKRRELEGMDTSRADIIVAGVLILEQVFEQLGLDSMVTAKYALREGILLDTLHKLIGEERSVAHLTDIRKASVLHLGESCHYEARHADTVRRMSLELFDQLRPRHGLGNAEREYLEAAALLHDIGYHISHSEHHKHSYYLIRHSELLGFTDREIEIIANVARYHRKSHPKIKHEGYPRLKDEDQRIVRALAGILRVADGLDRRHNNIFRSLQCTVRNAGVLIEPVLRRECDTSIEIWGAERRKELLEEELGLPVALRVTQTA
ncbi:MAG: Ppx/GppA family phosphatase [Bacteroidia bacterium]|nr:Ppx/GppA family phosphatase [Bacteroidia bacterium]